MICIQLNLTTNFSPFFFVNLAEIVRMIAFYKDQIDAQLKKAEEENQSEEDDQ